MELQALYNIFKQYPAVSTDTRHILPESLFFALKGANFNGNEFAEHALVSGARYVIIDEVQYKKDDRFILVDDVLKTLQALAHYHRQQFEIPFIGVTGTNGKTTTKELLNAVLSKTYKTYATKGNLNNHIGVPLTLLAIDQTIEIAIIEMGANHIGEIDFLCQIAAPTHGLISNVGKAHLEGFGSFEGVKKAKGELYDWLQDNQGTLFLQGDNPFLKEKDVDSKKLYVAFISTNLRSDSINDLRISQFKPDEASIDANRIYIKYAVGAGKTRFDQKYIEKKLNVTATIRNWNTVTQLLQLFGEK